jgi:hypothetical protein
MDVQGIVIVGRFGRRWLWCALGAMLALGPGTASAQGSGQDPCSNAHPSPIPNCQNQVQAPVSYNGLETKGWAFYCGGDRPYFSPIDGAWSIDNSIVSGSGFTGIENPAAETDSLSKMDATFTNWSVDQNNLIVTLACSDTAP